MANWLPLFPENDEKNYIKSLPMQIAEYIAKQIFQGTLNFGERLKEEELAARFHTSRAPIREALYLLQIDGLVERTPRRGTVVREYTEREITELYEVRLALEQLAVDRLRSRWSNEADSAFGKILDNMQNALEEGNSEEYSEQNTLFHHLLFCVAESEILARLYRQLMYPLQALLQFSTQTHLRLQASYKEHEQVVQCLRQHQFDTVKHLIAENVGHGMMRAIKSLKKRSGPDDTTIGFNN